MVGKDGHIMVAYDYDVNENGEDIIYCHNGYKENNTYGTGGSSVTVRKTIQTGRIYYAMALVPTATLTHVCSDNYVYTDANNVEHTHCPCELAEHPAHSHSYTYTSAGEDNHTKLCTICNTSVTEAHEYANYQYQDSTTHTCQCMYCDYSKTEEHDIEYYCSNDVVHVAVCVCIGNVESHSYQTVIIDGEEKVICIKCGHPDYCTYIGDIDQTGSTP